MSVGENALPIYKSVNCAIEETCLTILFIETYIQLWCNLMPLKLNDTSKSNLNLEGLGIGWAVSGTAFLSNKSQLLRILTNE